MIDSDELAAWLRLVETPGVGRAAARRLLAEFGSPQAVIDASVSARQAVAGAQVAAALAAEPPDFAALLATTLAWLGGAGGSDVAARELIVLGDPRYPEALLQTADPPTLLYAKGRVELLAADAIAIVGSRNPTPQGLENARAFAAHLSRAGLVVVSGLALGIDGAAHEGALEGAAAQGKAPAGGTIAVVGTGLDRVYPARHRALAHRIAAAGLIVSEFAIGTPSRPLNFPVRNRIIAGLARGTLVVEAALQSGSLITARLALEAGREVFAIPGSIHSPQSRGSNALLKQGAKLVDKASDILEEFDLARPRGAGGGGADQRPARCAKTRCSPPSASTRSASTRWSPAPGRAPPSSRRGSSTWSWPAGWRGCLVRCSSGSTAARACQRERLSPASAGRRPPFIRATLSERVARV